MKRAVIVAILACLIMAVAVGASDYGGILFENAAVFLTDGTNRLVINSDGSLDTGITTGAEIGITDGTDSLLIDGTGNLTVNQAAAVDCSAATVTVDGSGVTQPVSSASALDCSASTVSVQEASALDCSAATVPVSSASALDCSGATVTVDGSGVTQPVSSASALDCSAATVTVDGSGVTQPISIAAETITNPRDQGGTYQNYDSIEGATIILDLEHHMVHDGQHFTWSDYDEDIDTGAGSDKFWYIAAPNSATRYHCAFTIEVTDATLVYFKEGPTPDVASSALTGYNNDRNSATANTLTVAKDGTYSGEGTIIFSSLLGTSNPKARFGGVSRSQNEWILDQANDYLITLDVTNDNTEANMNVSCYQYIP